MPREHYLLARGKLKELVGLLDDAGKMGEAL
jgi:hypothetical protein